MLQDDFLILKGQGVFLHGHNADMYGNMRALAPNEVDDGVNPFHINPYTKKPFLAKDGYDVRNQYQAMVEEILYQVVQDNPHLKNNAEKQSMMRIDLRKKLNEAARKHNRETKKDRLRPDGTSHPHRHPEKVFIDTNDTNSVNPVLTSGVFTPEYQKMPVRRHPDTGEWDRGAKGDRIDPKYAKVKNDNGVYPDLQHSMVMHDDHGQMSESMFSVLLGEFLHLVKHGSEDGSSSQVYGDMMSKMPYTLSQGHVLPDALVIYNDPQTGRRSKVWNYRTTGKPGSLGRGPDSRGVLSGMPGGLMSLPDALATIHPIFFQPVHRAPSVERRNYARDIMYALTNTKVPEDTIENFAKSPVLYTLFEAQRGTGYSSTRSNTSTKRLVENVRLHALGIPNSKEGWKSDGDKRRYTEAETNIGRIGIEAGFLGENERPTHQAGINNLKEMVYLSVLLGKPGNEEAAKIVQHGAPGTESSLGWSSPGMAQGAATRDFYRRASSRMGRDHNDFHFLSYDDIPQQENRRANWEEQTPWAIDENFTEPQRSPFGGLFGTSPEYNESLYTLMESLQSASARMDDLVLKSLPAHRRFHIHDSYDRDELCGSYQVDDRDLYYINETLGDWAIIAKELKVRPEVVKGIKVALRW